MLLLITSRAKDGRKQKAQDELDTVKLCLKKLLRTCSQLVECSNPANYSGPALCLRVCLHAAIFLARTVCCTWGKCFGGRPTIGNAEFVLS